MNFIITVNYNEKGKKLTGHNNVQIKMDQEFKPTKLQIENFVYNEIPKQMVDNFILNDDNGLAQLKVGDLVKLTRTLTNTYSQTTQIELVKIVDINEKGIKVEYVNNYFQFNGLEKTRKKKDIAKIEIPTEQEIKDYNDYQEKTKMIEEIKDLIERGNLNYLENYQLKEILDLLPY